MNKHFFDIQDRYNFVNINEFIKSQNRIFGRNIPLVPDFRKVDFITICGYTEEFKESTITKISELMSRKSLRSLIENNKVCIGEYQNDNTTIKKSIHTIQKHIQILEREFHDTRCRLYLVQVNQNFEIEKVTDITTLCKDVLKEVNSVEFRKKRILEFIEK